MGVQSAQYKSDTPDLVLDAARQTIMKLDGLKSKDASKFIPSRKLTPSSKPSSSSKTTPGPIARDYSQAKYVLTPTNYKKSGLNSDGKSKKEADKNQNKRQTDLEILIENASKNRDLYPCAFSDDIQKNCGSSISTEL